MRSNIEVKFLTPKEMGEAYKLDSRYEHVQPDNLGFADPVKNRVFVRAGLDADLTKYLVSHELDHLFELEGTDEDENGIRHKKSGVMSWLAPIAMAVIGSILVPGLGGALAALPGFSGGLLGLGTGIMEGAVGTGIGAGLGGAAGSSMVGKPKWGQNMLSGAASGAGQIAGAAAGDAWGQPWGGITGEATKEGVGLLSNPSTYGGGSSNFGGMWNQTPSGFEGNVPTGGAGFTGGFTPGGNAPGGVGTGGQSGSIGQMANNMGTGQAGITLGAQTGVPNTGTMGQSNQNSQSNPWGNFGQSSGQSPMTGNNMETGFQPMNF